MKLINWEALEEMDSKEKIKKVDELLQDETKMDKCYKQRNKKFNIK